MNASAQDLLCLKVDLLDARLNNDALVGNAHALLATVFDKRVDGSNDDKHLFFEQGLQIMVPYQLHLLCMNVLMRVYG